jgi:transcriptional regulator with PAS, ATPase and Fis domain
MESAQVPFARQPIIFRMTLLEDVGAIEAVSAMFGSLGRVLLCLDDGFRLLYASSGLANEIGSMAAERVVGKPLSELLGEELFGEHGSLRQALLAGERREGWRAFLRGGSGLRLMSISAAPYIYNSMIGGCEGIRYIVVLRPAEDEPMDATGPTVLAGLIGRSAAMQHIFRSVENLQTSNATILITGESGTGKEVVARAIHAYSQARRGQFVAVSCGALPPDLLARRIEAATHGTLFFEDVGDLSLPLQGKLLRLLQEHTYERAGDTQSRSSDARVIAATNSDLRAAVRSGAFREDLYYRLRVVPIDVPPLRTRREDIEPLARFLLARVGKMREREIRFSPEALRALLRYPWPGNVRELENAIEVAVAVTQGQTIPPEDLPPEISAAVESEPAAATDDDLPRIRAALDASNWRRDDAAVTLGISRTTLWRRMRDLGLVRPRH